VDEAEECFGELVVAGGNAAGILETIEASFNVIAQRIDGLVNRDLHAPILFRRNDRDATAAFDIGANDISIVPAISQQHLGIGRVFIHQRLAALDGMRFARSDRGVDREAFRVRATMDFCREPAARTAKSVSLNPPFPPAA
jgi:hypothetical protein